MSDVTAILSSDKVDDIVSAFDVGAMNTLLVNLVTGQYSVAGDLIEEISKLFTGPVTFEGEAEPSQPLADRDRELILIALLAQRGERLNLAVHIYFALGLGVAPRQIAHVLLLVGMYAGLPAYTSALDVMRDTFAVLEGLTDLGAAEVVKSLASGFDLPPPA